MDLLHDLVLDTVCPRCLAVTGARCVTNSGGRARYFHADRTRPVYAGWRIGYHEGRSDALDVVERSIQPGTPGRTQALFALRPV